MDQKKVICKFVNLLYFVILGATSFQILTMQFKNICLIFSGKSKLETQNLGLSPCKERHTSVDLYLLPSSLFGCRLSILLGILLQWLLLQGAFNMGSMFMLPVYFYLGRVDDGILRNSVDG